MKPDYLDADWAPVYESPTKCEDPWQYIRRSNRRNLAKARRLTAFVQRLLAASAALFLASLAMAFLVG